MIHLFDWSNLIDGGEGLQTTFKVPNLETGKMEPLITGDDDGALTGLEEEQFRNMVNRLHKIFSVRHLYIKYRAANCWCLSMPRRRTCE